MPKQKQSRKHIWLYVVLAVVVIILCGVILVLSLTMLREQFKASLQQEGFDTDIPTADYCAKNLDQSHFVPVPFDEHVQVNYTVSEKNCFYTRSESAVRNNRVVINELQAGGAESVLSLTNIYDYSDHNWNEGIIGACQRNEVGMQTQSGKPCVAKELDPKIIPLLDSSVAEHIVPNKAVVVENYGSRGEPAYYFATDTSIFSLLVYTNHAADPDIHIVYR